MLTRSQYTLRPYATGQHERYLSTCAFIDGYLYSTGSKLYLVLEARIRGRNALPDAQALYEIAPDQFGLFTERKLYAAPNGIGALGRVDNLKGLMDIQRAQLRRLIVLLAMSWRASLPVHAYGSRHSVKLHCLTPKPCSPLDGIANHYATSGRAARDVELARRVREQS